MRTEVHGSVFSTGISNPGFLRKKLEHHDIIDVGAPVSSHLLEVSSPVCAKCYRLKLHGMRGEAMHSRELSPVAATGLKETRGTCSFSLAACLGD